MDEKKRKRVNMLTLAFGIAFMPPIWAVLSPYLGVSTGAVALICAGLYVANGNKRKDALKIAVGFLCGDLGQCLQSGDYGNTSVSSECGIVRYVVCAWRTGSSDRGEPAEADLCTVLALRLGDRSYDHGTASGCGTWFSADPMIGVAIDRRRRICGDRSGRAPEMACEKDSSGVKITRLLYKYNNLSD